MNPAELSDTLRDTLPGIFECSLAPSNAVRVRTPMLYPDGDLVDAFVVERGGEYLVTDFGDALGWLRMQSASDRLTRNQRGLVDDVCQTLGIERDRGELTLRCRDRAEIADAVHRLGQAAVRVADILFTFRPQAAAPATADKVADEVANEVDGWLRSRSLPVERGVRRSGRSGHSWEVDYRISTAEGTALVFLLTGAPAVAWRRTLEVFAGFSDLGAPADDWRPVSLFDDVNAEWRDENVKLVEKVSQPVMWSRPDELARVLMGGALLSAG